MSRKWWLKFVSLLLAVAGAVIYVIPTAMNLDLEKTKYFFKHKINLGLDLQGGVYMVLGVDFKKVYVDVMDRSADTLAEEMKRKDVACTTASLDKTKLDLDPKVNVTCTNKEAKEKLHKMVKDEFDTLRITDDKDLMFQFGISKLYKDTIREKTISQSIQVIRNRIDEFGVAEPVITSQGTDKLSVELPGVKDVERAKELIGRTAKLEFKLVDSSKSPDEVAGIVSEVEAKNKISYKEGERFSDYVRKINEAAKDKLPPGTEIAFEKEGGKAARSAGETGKFARIPYLLKSKADVTGDDLKDAYVQIDPQDNRPQVGLSFNTRGAENFGRVTGESIGRLLAIVLDGIVHSAPVIQSKIPNGRAQITLGQGDYNQILTDAKDLAIVLRAGALPAQLEFLEQRVVGPSLGADSIQKGKFAAMVGIIAVFLFMLLYYRMSGFIADISLVLNVLFVLAIFVGIDATLTLPGIAGIALTVGIAVDSNVVIYERIREELRAGKPARFAVNAGFEKAFHTILDANVVNAFAAIVLMNYGTGPIKGFAVTLLIGIVTTLFTAVFVSKLLFDWYLEKFEVKELSI